MFTKCPGCRAALLTADLEKNDNVCPQCEHHFPLSAARAARAVLDPGSFVEEDATIESVDPLGFKDSKRYADRLRAARRDGRAGATRSGPGRARSRASRSSSASSSSSSWAARWARSSARRSRACSSARSSARRPAIIFSASGGARMQEGVLSLMQMAKTSAALGRLREAGLPYISVLLHPTTGGVAASFAMLGDVILAEPKALIGFAGARVIQNTIRQRLPPGFQRAEFLLEHGFLDQIVHAPARCAPTLARLLRLLGPRAAGWAPRWPRSAYADLLARLDGAAQRWASISGSSACGARWRALGDPAAAASPPCRSPAPTARGRPPR